MLSFRILNSLYFILLVWARRSLVASCVICVFLIVRLSQAFSCGYYWIFVYFILLVWARRSLVAIYWILAFLIVRLSQAFSCGDLLNICILYCSFEPGVLLWPLIEFVFLMLVYCLVATYCVFHIARLSQAFSCGHLLHICFPYCSFEPAVVLWPLIEYLCTSYCSFEPGVLLWAI